MGSRDQVESSEPTDYSADLPSICYAAAYQVLPNLVFADVEEIFEHWETCPERACEAIYSLACEVTKVPPNSADPRMLRMHIGQLDDSRRYYIIEYAVPPPIDRAKFDPRRIPIAQCQVLAPHFSAVIRNKRSGETSYYVLGQSPSGGTTFRAIDADGANYNCGPGPEPKLEQFIQFLK